MTYASCNVVSSGRTRGRHGGGQRSSGSQQGVHCEGDGSERRNRDKEGCALDLEETNASSTRRSMAKASNSKFQEREGDDGIDNDNRG